MSISDKLSPTFDEYRSNIVEALHKNIAKLPPDATADANARFVSLVEETLRILPVRFARSKNHSTDKLGQFAAIVAFDVLMARIIARYPHALVEVLVEITPRLKAELRHQLARTDATLSPEEHRDVLLTTINKFFQHAREGGYLPELAGFITVLRRFLAFEIKEFTGFLPIPEDYEDPSSQSPAHTSKLSQEQNDLINDLVEKLPSPYREAIRMKFFGNMSNKEIAKELGKTETNIRVIIYRALKKLRDSGLLSLLTLFLLLSIFSSLLSSSALPLPRPAQVAMVSTSVPLIGASSVNVTLRSKDDTLSLVALTTQNDVALGAVHPTENPWPEPEGQELGKPVVSGGIVVESPQPAEEVAVHQNPVNPSVSLDTPTPTDVSDGGQAPTPMPTFQLMPTMVPTIVPPTINTPTVTPVRVPAAVPTATSAPSTATSAPIIDSTPKATNVPLATAMSTPTNTPISSPTATPTASPTAMATPTSTSVATPCPPDQQQPLDISLVIDASASMKQDGKLESAKTAAANFASLLAPQDQLSLVEFRDIAMVRQPLTLDHQRVITDILHLQANGGTRVGRAIQAATDELTSQRHLSSARSVMILLTDGLAKDSFAEASDAAEEAKAQKITIIAIGVGTPGSPFLDANFLKELVGDQTNYHEANSGEELPQIYNSIRVVIHTCSSSTPSGEGSVTTYPTPETQDGTIPAATPTLDSQTAPTASPVTPTATITATTTITTELAPVAGTPEQVEPASQSAPELHQQTFNLITLLFALSIAYHSLGIGEYTMLTLINLPIPTEEVQYASDENEQDMGSSAESKNKASTNHKADWKGKNNQFVIWSHQAPTTGPPALNNGILNCAKAIDHKNRLGQTPSNLCGTRQSSSTAHLGTGGQQTDCYPVRETARNRRQCHQILIEGKTSRKKQPAIAAKEQRLAHQYQSYFYRLCEWPHIHFMCSTQLIECDTSPPQPWYGSLLAIIVVRAYHPSSILKFS